MGYLYIYGKTVLLDMVPITVKFLFIPVCMPVPVSLFTPVPKSVTFTNPKHSSRC